MSTKTMLIVGAMGLFYVVYKARRDGASKTVGNSAPVTNLTDIQQDGQIIPLTPATPTALGVGGDAIGASVSSPMASGGGKIASISILKSRSAYV